MNITLSADRKTVAKAREIAKKRRTTLNALVRDYLTQLTQDRTREDAADEFERLAMEFPGSPDPDFTFSRDAIHDRSFGRAK